MVLVDGDVASDIVGSYVMWITCMLREIELMTLSGCHLYRILGDSPRVVVGFDRDFR